MKTALFGSNQRAADMNNHTNSSIAVFRLRADELTTIPPYDEKRGAVQKRRVRVID